MKNNRGEGLTIQSNFLPVAPIHTYKLENMPPNLDLNDSKLMN